MHHFKIGTPLLKFWCIFWCYHFGVIILIHQNFNTKKYTITIKNPCLTAILRIGGLFGKNRSPNQIYTMMDFDKIRGGQMLEYAKALKLFLTSQKVETFLF